MYANAPSDDNEDTADGNGKDKELGDLASKISIAGIDDAYKAESPFVRALFLGSMAVFALAMIYSSCNIGIRYGNEESIALNWRQVDGVLAPFPNVTFCFPLMTNAEIKKDLIYSSPSAQRKMRRLNVSQEEAASFLVANFFDMGSLKSEENVRLGMVAKEIVDATVTEYGMRGFFQRLFSCERSFANCYFDGAKFNCCQAATFMANFNGGVCWEINVAAVFNSSNAASFGPSLNSNKLVTGSGLSVELRYDRGDLVTFNDEPVTSDGFMVLLGPPSPLASSPAVVPSGADARVVLAPPIRNMDIDSCERNERKLTKFVDRYDASGLYCAAEMLVKFQKRQFGCDAAILTYYPDEMNDTECDAAMLFKLVAMTSSSGASLDIIDEASEVIGDTRLVEAMTATLEADLRAIAANRICPPACERWTYSVWSTSYGYIKYAGDEVEQNWHVGGRRSYRSKSAMSRIRVFFPTASYEIWSQEEVAMSYLEFCEIAGVWGVYLGFSIVTFVQTLAYGAMIVQVVRKRRRLRRRKNEVAPIRT